MLIISTIEFQKLTHTYIYNFVGSKLVNFDFLNQFCWKIVKELEIYFYFLNSKYNMFALDSNPILCGDKNALFIFL